MPAPRIAPGLVAPRGYVPENPDAYLTAIYKRSRYRLGGVSSRDFSQISGASSAAATPATRYAQTAGGVLVPFAANKPRITDQGRLEEPSRANLAIWSQAFDNASWSRLSGGTGSAPVVTADAALAPDGTMTADRIVFSLNGGTSSTDTSALQQGVVFPDMNTHSIWLRADAPCVIGLRNPANNGTYTAVALTTSWQRFSVSGDPATDTSFQFGLRGALIAGVSNAATVYAWGGQVEAGGTATSYIPTTSASMTRAADSDAVANLSNLTAGDFAVLTKAGASGATSTQFPTLLRLDDGTGNNMVQVYRSSTNVYLNCTNAGVTTTHTLASGISYATPLRAAIGRAGGVMRFSLNGSPEANVPNSGGGSAPVAPSGLVRLVSHTSNENVAYQGYIEEQTIWLAAKGLQALTA